MDDRLKMALGLGALGVGGYLLLTKTGVLASQTPTGLRPVPHQPSEEEIQPGYINIEIPPLTVSEDPLKTDVPRADWPPNQAAAYMFVKFLDAYEEYAKHRLPFALSRMRNYVMRMQGSAYSHLTRADLWTSDQLRKLVTTYRWEYVTPSSSYVLSPEDRFLAHFLVAGGARCKVPAYAVSRDARVRDVMTQLLYDAQAGKLYSMPALKAIVLPWYTVAQETTFGLNSYTYEWKRFWESKGLRVEPCGTKRIKLVGSGMYSHRVDAMIKYYCVRG